MQLHFEYPGGMTRAPGSLGFGYRAFHTWIRLWGPGRVAVQSVFTNEAFHYARVTSSSATIMPALTVDRSV